MDIYVHIYLYSLVRSSWTFFRLSDNYCDGFLWREEGLNILFPFLRPFHAFLYTITTSERRQTEGEEKKSLQKVKSDQRAWGVGIKRTWGVRNEGVRLASSRVITLIFFFFFFYHKQFLSPLYRQRRWLWNRCELYSIFKLYVI